MSGSNDSRKNHGECSQEQQSQSGHRSGEGSGSALTEMLKKRREDENQPNDEQAEGGDKRK